MIDTQKVVINYTKKGADRDERSGGVPSSKEKTKQRHSIYIIY